MEILIKSISVLSIGGFVLAYVLESIKFNNIKINHRAIGAFVGIVVFACLSVVNYFV